MSEEVPPTPSRRIVSSRHLAEGDGWEASELEYGMIIAYNAFTRWMSRCMAAAGNGDLTPLEILVLHNANHRGREKRLTDICFLLNIEDTHTVNYALRKLVKAELLSAEKRGKEVFYRTSPAGADLCEAYRADPSGVFSRWLAAHRYLRRGSAQDRGAASGDVRAI